ncbi:MAG: hypothetical protein ABGZ35_27570 [Planctomycetaceae bacterium]
MSKNKSAKERGNASKRTREHSALDDALEVTWTEMASTLIMYFLLVICAGASVATCWLAKNPGSSGDALDPVYAHLTRISTKLDKLEDRPTPLNKLSDDAISDIATRIQNKLKLPTSATMDTELENKGRQSREFKDHGKTLNDLNTLTESIKTKIADMEMKRPTPEQIEKAQMTKGLAALQKEINEAKSTRDELIVSVRMNEKYKGYFTDYEKWKSGEASDDELGYVAFMNAVAAAMDHTINKGGLRNAFRTEVDRLSRQLETVARDRIPVNGAENILVLFPETTQNFPFLGRATDALRRMEDEIEAWMDLISEYSIRCGVAQSGSIDVFLDGNSSHKPKFTGQVENGMRVVLADPALKDVNRLIVVHVCTDLESAPPNIDSPVPSSLILVLTGTRAEVLKDPTSAEHLKKWQMFANSNDSESQFSIVYMNDKDDWPSALQTVVRRHLIPATLNFTDN